MIETVYDLSCPIMLAFLADFHNSKALPVLRSLETAKPEIIAIAGDVIYGDDPNRDKPCILSNPHALELLRGCAGIAPTFLSFGNHEWMLADDDLEVISAAGITLLDNCWANYKGTLIGGLSSRYYTQYQALRAAHPERGRYPVTIRALHELDPLPELDWLDAFEQQEGYRILLSHHPEYYPKYLQHRKIDLILSGHAHGGQWRYYSIFRKRWQGVFAPGQGLFPPLTSGVHDGRLVISRGLSNPTRVPRIHNPPEVVYIGRH